MVDPTFDVFDICERVLQGKIGAMSDDTALPESLIELAQRYGVATEYTDWTHRAVAAVSYTHLTLPTM